MSQLAESKEEKKARHQEKHRLAKVNKERQQRQCLKELEREFYIESKIRLKNNGPDDTDLINAVTSGCVIEIERVLKERDAYSQRALNKSLLLAANNGQKLTLILLLKYGACINWTDENGNTSLMVCAEKGFLDMAKILLANKASAKKINTSGNTALILAIKPSGAAYMVSLLASRSNVNVKNHKHQTALSKAVESGDLETIHILILYGASLNIVINGETIQELAARKGILQYIKVLSDCRISKDPPLIAALKYRDILLLETILTYEPFSINQRSSQGCTVLESFFDLILNEEQELTSVDKSIVKLLLARGVHINKKDPTKSPKRSSASRLPNDNYSILVKAVQIGDLDIVRWLYIKGSQVNESLGYDQLTPLMMASKCGFLEITKFLLSKGADIEVRKNEGTSLDIAVKYGHLDCAKILLEEKAKKGLVEAYKTAIEYKQLCLLEHLDETFRLDIKETRLMEWAIQYGSVEILQYLINKGMDVNGSIPQQQNYTSRYAQFLCPLHIAVMNEKPELVKFLLQSKADIEIKDSNGNTAIFYACTKNGSELLTLLLEFGSEVNVTNNKGRTPLFDAIESKEKMNVTLLLNSGASVNICDNKGETPMLKAIQGNSLEIVSLLIDWKADTSAITKNGGTYIMELLRSFDYYSHSQTIVHILKLLLKEKMFINQQDDNGDTALMLACKSQYLLSEAVKILLEHGADVNLINRRNKTAFSLSLTGSDFTIAKMLLQKKAKCYPLSICQQVVHLFISKNELELIPLALGNGVFPFVMKPGYSSDRLFYISYRSTTNLSPLSQALQEKRLDLAKYLIQVRFLTKYDVGDLLKTDIFQETNLSTKQGNIFNNLLSLYTLSFVQISEMLGATLNREEKVSQLPLPTKMKQQLLYRSLNVPLVL